MAKNNIIYFKHEEYDSYSYLVVYLTFWKKGLINSVKNVYKLKCFKKLIYIFPTYYKNRVPKQFRFLFLITETCNNETRRYFLNFNNTSKQVQY